MIEVAIVIAYLGTMLLIGWRSRKQSPDSYWIADRRYGTGLITTSLLATIFGATSTIGIVGLGYLRGLTGAWWALIGGVALLPLGLVLASRLRSYGVYTLPDVLRRAYGDRVAVPAACLICVAWCGIVAAQITAAGRLLSGILPLDHTIAMTIAAAAFILYSFWGGQVSVIRTDSGQFWLFLAGMLTCVSILLVHRVGLGVGVWYGVPSEHLRFPVSRAFGWYDVVVYYPLIVGLPYMVGPDIYSRIFCARDGRVARQAVIMAAVAVVPVALLLAGLGVLIRAEFPGLAQDAALPTAINNLMPTGVKGLLATAFLAAIMSSADTTLVSASTILSLNVIGPVTNVSRATQLRITRLAVVLIGLLAWGVAGLQEGIIPSLLLAYTVFVGGVVVPTLASFGRIRLRITATGAMCAVLVGGAAAIAGEINDGTLLATITSQAGHDLLQSILGREYRSILPIVLSLATLVGVSMLTRDRPGTSNPGAEP